MSYCRWSSDDFQCDLYCYESDAGYVTHVANYRTVFENLPEEIEFTKENIPAYVERFNKVLSMVGESPKVEIGLPYDGESFTDGTLEEFKTTVQMLKDAGYRVPDYVFERIDEEIADDTGRN